MPIDANALNLLLQLPVVGLFCYFILTLLKQAREYLQNRDHEMNESLLIIAKSMDTISSRLQQNTLILLAMHSDISPAERQQIINKI